MSPEIEKHLFNEEELKEVQMHIDKYPQKMAATLPVLWMLQKKFGWISKESMEYAAKLLDVPNDHIVGVISFYTMYNAKPVGKVHLQVCTNVSCMLRGSDELFDYISRKHNIKNKETTEDGTFTLEKVECLGSCGTAPMMQVNNEDYYENLKIETIDGLLEELKQKHSGN